MMVSHRTPSAPLPPAARTVTRTNVTSIDVARLADVSQSAVSRSFTPGASVAPETRARVLEAARKLGYRPNATAIMRLRRELSVLAMALGR